MGGGVDRVQVAEEATGPLTVNVAVPHARRLTEAAMLTGPEAGQDEPALARQVQVAPVKAAGKVSVTAAPVTRDGLVSVAKIGYLSVVPALIEVLLSVLLIARSELRVIVVESLSVL